MKAGALDRTVTILRQQPSQHDGYQNKPGAFVAIGSRRASLKPARGREAFSELGTEAYSAMSLWLRYDRLTRSITAKDAVDVDGRRYQLIAPPMEIGRREGIELVVVAGD